MLAENRKLIPVVGLGAVVALGGFVWNGRVHILKAFEGGLWTLLGHKKLRKDNVYLQGNYAPVEESEQSDLEVVEGSLPLDLDGAFVRVGPNPALEPIGDLHWFDGDGMTHVVRIKDGKASYASRYVDTHRLRLERKYNYPLFAKFGDMRGLGGLFMMPLLNLKRRLGLVDAEKDGAGTANTALVYHAQRLLALNEGDLPYEIRVMCDGVVETVGRMGELRGAGWDAPFTAHPKRCAKTGELHFFGYSFKKNPYVTYGALDVKGNLIAKVGIELPKPIMLHDFAISENFAVFADVPLGLDGENMVKTGGFLFHFDETRPLRFGLAPRVNAKTESGSIAEVQWFDTMEDGSKTKAAVIMHVANAYETDGGKVVKFLACLYNKFDLDIRNYEKTVGGSPVGQGDYTEISLNRETGRVSYRVLHPDQYITDFPRVHDDKVASPDNRFCYLATISKGLSSVLFDGVIKVDHTVEGEKQGLVAEHSWGPRCYGGEAVFIHRKGSTAEDDGYVMTYVFSEDEGVSYFKLLNAKDLKPIAKVRLPGRVPYGFHGAWLTGDQIAQQRTRA